MKMVQIFVIITVFFMLNLIPFSSSQALFFDFEDEAQLDEWEILSGSWLIEKDKITNSNVLSCQGADDLVIVIGVEDLTDYTIELEASGLTDDIGIAFRLQDLSTYYGFLLSPNLNLSEWFLKKGGAYDENLGKKGTNLGIPTNEWHKYKLVVEGMEARIYVDGEEPFDALKIDKGFEKGRLGVRHWGDYSHYDNISISGPGIPLSSGEAVNPADKLANVWGAVKR